MAQQAGDPQLSYQLLIYPGIDMTCSLPSHTAFADGYRLTRELITWFYQAYFSTEDDVTHWQASPINAHSLAGLPPAYILSAGYDPLQDENKSYAYKLEGAGVPVTYRHYPDMIHGFTPCPGLWIALARPSATAPARCVPRSVTSCGHSRLVTALSISLIRLDGYQSCQRSAKCSQLVIS